MKIGMNYRNWGPHATRDNLLACARIADESTLDSIWVNDHIGFPAGDWDNVYGISPEVGSMIDPFATMAFLSAVTSRITFGSAVIVGPYRPPLPTAKWLQSIQILSGDRMVFGVGPGYLTEEFIALGVPKSKRGQLTDELLDILHKAFSASAVECNGQSLILMPQPKRPSFIIGGSANIAIPRAITRGDGWMPVGISPGELKPLVAEMQRQTERVGRNPLEVIAMKTLPLDDLAAAVDLAQAYRDAGATHLVHTQSYSSPAQYQALVDIVTQEIRPSVQ
jgi:alkanesulfonate monooxygenase SsuD/methylene tetrahydromethanopterin reductase-like flavin-dependent oxidoreductase (luciferase family)